MQLAADAVEGQRRNPTQVVRAPTEELGDSVGAPQIEVRVVLPGDADAAQHLNAVLGVALRGVDPGGGCDRRGDGQLPGIGRRDRRIGGRHSDLLGPQQHLGAHVLDGLEAADRLAELLPHLGVLGGGVQRPLGDPRRLRGEECRGEVGELLTRHRQPDRRNRVQHHPGQRPGEVGGLQWFDHDAVGAGINDHHVLTDRQQQQSRTQSAQHVLGGARDPPGILAEIGAQRGAGGQLPGRQCLQQCGIGHHQGGQRGGHDRSGDQRPCRLVHHCAQVDHRAAGATVLLRDGDTEQAQLGNAVVDLAPGVGMAVLDVPDGVGSAGTGRPTPNQLTRGELFFGDGRGHRGLLQV